MTRQIRKQEGRSRKAPSVKTSGRGAPRAPQAKVRAPLVARRGDVGRGARGPAAAPTTVPARANRYTPEQRDHALRLILSGMSRVKIAETVGCTTESLRSVSDSKGNPEPAPRALPPVLAL